MTGQRIMFDLRMQIYGHLQRLDVAFYDRNPVGRLMTRVTTDVDALNELFTAGVVSVFGDVFTLVAIMTAMLMLDWRLALIAFPVLPLIALVTQWFRVHVRETYRDVRMWIARINAFLQEHITGMSTVQLFRREARNFERVRRDQRTSIGRANIRSIFYYAVFYPAIEIVGALATALLLWFGGGARRAGHAHARHARRVHSVRAALLPSDSDLSEKFNVLQAAMASSERIFQLLDTPVAIADRGSVGRQRARTRQDRARTEADQAHQRHLPDIAFDHVWFAYNDEDWVLRDVSFRSRRASASASSARPARGRRRSSTCCCGSTT